jgi:hypothetical protein
MAGRSIERSYFSLAIPLEMPVCDRRRGGRRETKPFARPFANGWVGASGLRDDLQPWDAITDDHSIPLMYRCQAFAAIQLLRYFDRVDLLSL